MLSDYISWPKRFKMKLLVLGFNTRALAEQALSEGFEVVAIESFADCDWEIFNREYPNSSEVYAIKGDYRPEKLIDKWEEIDKEVDYLIYLSDLDDYPNLLEKLELEVLGNQIETLKRLKQNLFSFLKENKIKRPKSFFSGADFTGLRLLKKPYLGGGGVEIREFDSQEDEIEWDKYYLQEYLPGRSCSVNFIANGNEAKIISFNKQLVGESRLGAKEFKYSGNILLAPNEFSANARKYLIKLINLLTQEFNLLGLNGVDFIYQDGEVYFIELNPRYTAAMELLSLASDYQLLKAHYQAKDLELTSTPKLPISSKLELAKGIVYAKDDLVVKRDFLAEFKEIKNLTVRDIPYKGEKFLAGEPLCTLLVKAANRVEIWSEFELAQKIIYQSLVERI